MSDPDEVEIRRRLRGSVAEVFSWWTDPAKLAEWMSPVGIAEAEVDLRVGGAFRIVMKGGDVVIDHTGEYLEVEPPRRLVFTWKSPFTGPEGSVVTIDLQPDGPNATFLRLVHSRLPREAVASHRDGWGTMLDRMATGLAQINAEGG